MPPIDRLARIASAQFCETFARLLAVRYGLPAKHHPHPPRGILEVQGMRFEHPVSKLKVPLLRSPNGPPSTVSSIARTLHSLAGPTEPADICVFDVHRYTRPQNVHVPNEVTKDDSAAVDTYPEELLFETGLPFRYYLPETSAWQCSLRARPGLCKHTRGVHYQSSEMRS